MKKILTYIKRETVLMVSLVLAILSMFLVHPDRKYISYIDWHSITLLFCLMAVMAGFKETGLFRTIGNALLAHVHTTRQLFLVLVLLPFVFSMFITNDVSLITFVPFAIIVLSMSEKEHLIIPVVVMQTIAANLGSMLMPMGNPQNLYLYAKSGMSLGTFVEIMLPYTIASLLGILISMFFIKQHAIVIDRNDNAVKLPKKQIILYSIAFVLCLLNVAKLLDIRILFAIILYCSCLYREKLCFTWTTHCSAHLSDFSYSSEIWSACQLSNPSLKASLPDRKHTLQSVPARLSATCQLPFCCRDLQRIARHLSSAPTSADLARSSLRWQA